MSFYTRQRKQVPALNTSSLPDLIFTVLFFFMIVTHIRKVDVKVKYREPVGTELSRLTKKSATSYIYIGKPYNVNSGKMVIQLNDKFATPAEIIDFVEYERNKMAPEDKQRMIVSIKADRNTPMRTITEIKQALRQSGALTINYAAENKTEETRLKR
jgi:biopolymer transport protein ExbD